VSPRIVAIGPNFQDIANTKGMTATAVRVFLTTSHPKMPNLILAPEQITDVIAYILSLRERC
jgi:cytochrome c